MTSFSWTHYLNVAHELVDIPITKMDLSSQEAYYRSAASRAYYAAYKTSNDWIDVNVSRYAPATGSSSHEDMINHLIRSIQNQNSATSVRQWFLILRLARMDADYHQPPNAPWNRGRAELVIKTSEKLCNHLSICVPK
jgi:hypothetical protein